MWTRLSVFHAVTRRRNTQHARWKQSLDRQATDSVKLVRYEASKIARGLGAYSFRFVFAI